jgi:iron-sulfur cluster assembly protein
LLFYVKGGGSNGFNYKLKPSTNPRDKLDEIVNIDKDINIIIDSKSVFHLLGTTIDWKKDITGESFHFENPNATSKCGSGTSFSI